MNTHEVHFFQRTWVAVVLVSIIAIIPYVNIFQNSLAYDDTTYLLRWDAVTSLHNISIFFAGEAPTLHQHIYRPIRSVAMAIVYAFSSTQPVGYHVFSLLVQIASSILVYFISRKLLHPVAALLSAAIFAVLPVHTEAITFITASFEVGLGIFFLLLSFYFYIVFRDTKKLYAYGLSLIAATLAFFTYEQTFVLPALLILYDITIRRNSVRNVLSTAKRYILYIAVALFWFVIRFFIVPKRYIGSFNDAIPFIQRLLTATKSVAVYLYLMIVSWPLTIYHPLEISSMLDVKVIVSVLLIGGLMYAGILLYKKQLGIYAFIIYWFLLSLLPVSNIVQLANFINERYLYLASISWSLLAGALIYTLYERLHHSSSKVAVTITAALSIVVIGTYGYMTWERNKDWKNDLTLYTSALAMDDQFVRGQVGVAQYYRDIKKYDEAIRAVERAMQLNSSYYLNYVTLGEIYLEQGDFRKALEYLGKSIELEPNYATAHLNQGVAYYSLSMLPEAEKSFLAALAVYPDYYQGNKDLGAVYLDQKKYEQAIVYLERVIALRPFDVEALNGLAEAYAALGKTEQARQYTQKALQLDQN